MNATPDLMAASLKMLTGLAVVIAALLAVWYVARQFAGRSSGAPGGKPIRVLANTCIGMKKNISLVRVPGEILVLGVTNDRITCLTKIRQEDWAADAEERDSGRPNPVASFMSQLKKEMGGGHGKGNDSHNTRNAPDGCDAILMSRSQGSSNA